MKKRFALVAFLAALVATCFALALSGCGSKKEKHQITWKYDATLVTVTAEGYDTLPTELEEDTEFVFSVTPNNGYSVTVSGASKDGDNYKFTVAKKDITVTVNATKTLNGITVALKNANKVYYEDDTVEADDITVTANYALGDEPVTTGYTISYPNGASAFVGGDTTFTVSFGGKEQTVELKTAVKVDVQFNSATLSVNASSQPVLTLNGVYNKEGDEAAIKTAVEGFINNCMERNTWTTITYETSATIKQNNEFDLAITITGQINDGGQYYFHFKAGADGMDITAPLTNASYAPPSANETAVTADTYTGDPVVAANGAKYYVGTCESWSSKAIMIHYSNPDAAKWQNVSLESKDGKAYVVFNGTGVIDEAALLKMVTHLDLEDIKNGNAKLADYVVEPAEDAEEGATSTLNSAVASIDIDANTKTFKLWCLLDTTATTGEGDTATAVIKDGSAFMAHLGVKGSSGYYPNVSLPGAEGQQPITVGGFKYSFATATDLGLTESWQANLLYVKVETVA